MPKNKTNQLVHIQIPVQLLRRIDSAAASCGMTRSAWLRSAARYALDMRPGVPAPNSERPGYDPSPSEEENQ